MATQIEPKLFLRSGFAISCIGHMVILAIGLIFAGANPFDSVPADAITVEIVSPNEVGAGADNSGTAPTGGPETAPSSEPAASASQPQATPPSTPQPTPRPTPQATPQATTPPDQRTTRQASAPTQSAPSSPPSFVPWLQRPPEPPPPEPPPPAETHELNPADMFGMPLAMPDGRLGGGFDAAASDKADISNDNIAAFHQHLKTCSKLPAGVSVADDVKAVVRVFLKPDGTLAARPEAIRVDGVSRGGGELYRSIVAALRKCQPFNMLPPERYEEWKVFDLSFTPESFGGG